MTGRRLLPNSDAFGGGMGTASAWGGAFGWQWRPNQETERSGYWRLFFTQMQEEALKQYEEKTGKKVEKMASVEAKKTSKKKPLKVVKEVSEVEEPQSVSSFVAAPVKTSASVGELLAKLPELPAANDPYILAVLSAKVVELRISKQRREQRRRAAVFLLLAA